MCCFFDDAKIRAFPIQWYTKHVVYTTITSQYTYFYVTLLPKKHIFPKEICIKKAALICFYKQKLGSLLS